MGQQLADATAFADEPGDADPDDELRRIFIALVATAMANRKSGGLYRWEWRYLCGDDSAELMGNLRLVHRRIQRPLVAMRPQLTANERWTLSTSALSVIGSIVDHRVALPAEEISALLLELATTVSWTPLAVDDPVPIPPQALLITEPLTGRAGRYEALLHHSLTLFNKQGYRDTTMEEIAAAVGIPTSGIYRYFSGKRDVLTAVFRRAADRVAADLSAVLAGGRAEPAEALRALVAAYVASAFANPELGYVYYTEHVHLPAADQAVLTDVQRATIGTWVELLCAARPDMDRAHARFAVHAAMALVIDVGRLVGYDDSARVQAGVCRLMMQTLGV